MTMTVVETIRAHAEVGWISVYWTSRVEVLSAHYNYRSDDDENIAPFLSVQAD